MPKNTLEDLQNHLFMCLERLNDEDLSAEELKLECDRSRSVAIIAQQINTNVSNVIKAEEMRDMRGNENVPKLLGAM